MFTIQPEANPKAPTHTVYYLRAKDGADKPDWIKVGVAWEHGDKDGLNLSLTILGQEVAVTIRKNKLKAE